MNGSRFTSAVLEGLSRQVGADVCAKDDRQVDMGDRDHRLACEAAEARARKALAEGDIRGAASEVAQAFGPELLGFLVGVVDDGGAGLSVYGNLSDRIVEELSFFEWRCPLRVWAYAMARRELETHRAGSRPAQTMRSVPPVTVPNANADAPLRPFQMRAAIAAVKSELAEADRELLILRIDRAFEWHEIALTSLGERATRAEIERAAEQLKARFAVLRAQLLLTLGDRRVLSLK